DLVVLPITIRNNDQNEKEIKLHSSADLMSDGFLHAARWFRDAENIWNIYRTEKNKNYSVENYLNWQNKLTEQNFDAPYLVLYNSSGVNASSTIIEREKLDIRFIVDHKTYTFFTNDLKEAFYLTGIFNSSIPNKMMKDFQSRGLWGTRDVHKKILDIYFPKFDETNELHLTLAELSKTAHEKAEKYTIENSPQNELSATRLGRYRLEIKKHLHKEMTEIDVLVRKVIV
ncbi:MAG: SAM-dependent DNA methyltransferase, partial [Ignavibacteriae bacterium]|nr:SAM-dependent DNA methyltransferase [Ignavibacteriota bacterium]